MDFESIRQQVIRRVRYVTNTHALQDDRVPPEGPYDAALTNGLLAIVAHDWPGEEISGKGFTMSANELLDLITKHGEPFSYLDSSVLRDGITTTQPMRHGRSDDEFAALSQEHLAALVAIDQHPSLRFLDSSRSLSLNDCIRTAFFERATADLPWDPKERLLVPEPEECDECWRPTFLPEGWDMFGGTSTQGVCIACGYERTEEHALENAIGEEAHRLTENSD